MRVLIQPSYDEMSKWTARYIADKIKSCPKDKPYVLGLPTGSTPIGTYKELIRLHKEEGLSFKNVVTFNMDEYCGLDAKHPQSYHFFMKENFFKHIDINPAHTHILNGKAQNKEIECENYEKAIKNIGGIDLFLGGVGTDGHIAFNEPASSLVSKTREKTLTEETIKANARFFDSEAEVPKTALTVGVGTIMAAKEVVILINGEAKAEALHEGVEGAVSQMWTITALQMHEKGIIVCDEAVAKKALKKTYNYFKDIEKDNLKTI